MSLESGLAHSSRPQTPFAEFLVAEHDAAEATTGPDGQTPFVTEYFASPGEEVTDPSAGELVQLLDELHDGEFDELLYELVDDVRHAHQQQFEFEYQDAAAHDAAAERFLSGYLGGLQEEIDRFLDHMAQAAAEQDPARMTERQLDSFLTQFEASDTTLSPLFEEFFGKLVESRHRRHPVRVLSTRFEERFLCRPL